MERTMTTIMLVLFTLIGVAVIVSVLGGFRGEFLVERIDCESPCAIGPASCVEGSEQTCIYNDQGCPTFVVAECTNGCNASTGTCIP